MVIRLSFFCLSSIVCYAEESSPPPAGTITRQGTRSRLLNRKAIRLEKSPHHGILCNYTLWSISMVHGNGSVWSPFVIPERISACFVPICLSRRRGYGVYLNGAERAGIKSRLVCLGDDWKFTFLWNPTV